jgi:Protein of unknown function (DUF2752)
MKLEWPKPNRTLGFFDVLGLLGLLGLLVARFVPVARLPFWGCALRQRTGWPCPSCGLTRVAERVAHGNLAGAWEANPLGTVGAVLFALIALTSLLHLLFKLPVPDVRLTRREAFLTRTTIVLLVLFNYAYLVVKAKFPGLL